MPYNDAVTDLYLRITNTNISELDEYEFEVARPCDDKTEPGKCLMTVNRKSANKIRDFLQKKPRGVELMGALMERLNDQDVPMPDHHELRIVDATPDDGFQDQHVLGGGSVVAERLADRLLDYQPADAPLHSSLDPKEPDTSPGSRGKTHPRSKKSSKKK